MTRQQTKKKKKTNDMSFQSKLKLLHMDRTFYPNLRVVQNRKHEL